MSVAPQFAARVRRRAQGRCEYCRMSQALQGATFHIEHIIHHPRRLAIRHAEATIGLFPPEKARSWSSPRSPMRGPKKRRRERGRCLQLVGRERILVASFL